MPRVISTLILLTISLAAWSQNILVLQSDFGNKDGAVAAMKGVAVSISPDLKIYDLTHDIPAFNVWEASLRLIQTAPYWPPGTVFISVVDPGVGTTRKSVVLKTKSNQFFVTPDNGTLTFVAQNLGIEAVREIDEAVNRLKNSEASYTFHGRDVYAYTGARLAGGLISFEEVGHELPAEVSSIAYQKAQFKDNSLRGNIPILDVQFGNVWTNIDREIFSRLGLSYGDNVEITILHRDQAVLTLTLPYARSFAEVAIGKPLLYLNSLNNASFALNQGSFVERYNIASGADWDVVIKKVGN